MSERMIQISESRFLELIAAEQERDSNRRRWADGYSEIFTPEHNRLLEIERQYRALIHPEEDDQ